MFSKIRRLLPGKWGKSANVVPVIRMHGSIGPGGPLKSELSIGSLSANLEKAFSFKKAPVVAILVNSPGGSPVQSHFIYQRIRMLAEENEKGVLVFVEDIAASGGYMIALAGDEIFVDECSLVGSIGVLFSGFGFVDLISKIGVERRVHTSGENKADHDPFLPEDKEDVKHLKELQQEIHTLFIDMVKNRRKDLLSQDENLFDGRVWTGVSARKLGLVDEIGDVYSVIRSRFGEDVKFKLIGGDHTFLKRGKQGINFPIDGALSGLGRELIASVEERLKWSRFGL